ncbi:LuxR C-terminal-related transcriptional regulator [Nocardioides acrostichi]|uniref:Response regulator transcription factor n=1 Tax=Nocardioides acrostichi TaxID=2784339 RepID=A0A930UTX4_9ACTN|nr:response regulator transcription factor [Nocardioides acrostichi]MBF4160121.1 response regulator transcription factor [Nocardioides acrostichi]
MSTHGPVRVAIVNDYDVVVAGVAALLKAYGDRVRVVELSSGMSVLTDVDIVLYDTFGRSEGLAELERLVRDSDAVVVAYSWDVEDALVDAVLAAGARGYLPKSVTAGALVEALERVHAGQVVRPRASGVSASDGSPTSGEREWPGRAHGLSEREGEVIALITQGLSNREIAERSYLSINSVKTYVRTAYRKIGVHSRTQAALWGVRHGFSPDRNRTVGEEAVALETDA